MFKNENFNQPSKEDSEQQQNNFSWEQYLGPEYNPFVNRRGIIDPKVNNRVIYGNYSAMVILAKNKKDKKKL